MSWVDVPTRQPKASGEDPPVTISVSPANRRNLQRMYLVVRADRLDGLIAWWKPDGRVRVQQGEGPNVGRLRLAPGGEHVISAPMGRNAASPILQVAALSGLPPAGLKQSAVLWEIVDDALFVTLPWSGVRGAANVEQSPAPPAAPAANAPPPMPGPSKPAPLAASGPVRIAAQKTAQPPLVSAKPPVTVTFGEVERWAIANALGSATHGFDLALVNQRRIRSGDRPFVIHKGPRP